MGIIGTIIWILIIALIITLCGSSKSIVHPYAFERRSVALCIFLSIITCGIYFIYWFGRIVKVTKEFHGNSSSSAGEMCLNLFVPFYAYYWFYTRNYQLSMDAYKRGTVMKDSSVSCLVFALLGMPIISLAIMQNNMNHYIEQKQIDKFAKGSVTKEPSSTSPKTKLSELQDLLTSGLITQEDYDEKKKEILDHFEDSVPVSTSAVFSSPKLHPPVKKNVAPIIILFVIIILGSIGSFAYYSYAEKQQQIARQKQLEEEYAQAQQDAVYDQLAEQSEQNLRDSIAGKEPSTHHSNLRIFQGSDPSSNDSTSDSYDSSYSYEDSHEPFYSIWCTAFKTLSPAEESLEKWTQRNLSADVYVTTDWSNLNSEKWYVIGVGKYTTEEEANAALPEVKKYCKDAYVNYSGYYIGE